MATILGGAGSDTLVGTDGPDLIVGNGGADDLEGGFGKDTLYGGDGDDVLHGSYNLDGDEIYGGNGSDYIYKAAAAYGGLGNDVYNLLGSTNPIEYKDEGIDSIATWGSYVSLASVPNIENLFLSVMPFTSEYFINYDNKTEYRFFDHWFGSYYEIGSGGVGVGNALNNTIVGTNYADTLIGGEGADSLFGEGGADSLVGGPGDDSLHGYVGADTLEGGLGDDALDGGWNFDVAVFSGPRSRYTWSPDGSGGVTIVDSLADGDGRDTLRNIEQLKFSDGSQLLLTIGSILSVTAEVATQFESRSDKALFTFKVTRSGDLSALTTVNYHFAPGTADLDDLTGQFSGALSFEAGVKEALITIRPVVDLVAEADETFLLFIDTPSAGTSILQESAEGLIFDIDTVVELRGTESDDVLLGTPRFETIYGLGGDDLLSGGSGWDTLSGGDGNDILFGVAAGQRMDGGDGNDTVSLLNSTFGNIDSVNNYYYSSIENLTGSNYNDTLRGDGGANILDGGLGSDSLVGGGGADTLISTSGSDVLDGGEGNDLFAVTLSQWRSVSVVLGSGLDVIQIGKQPGVGYGGATIAISDFVVGDFGDRLEWSSEFWNELLSGLAPGTNPFKTGYARLEQDRGNYNEPRYTILWVDLDGAGSLYQPLQFITFSNVIANQLTPFNLGGFVSNLVLIGSEAGDTLIGTAESEIFDGGAGDDSITGGGGDDRLTGGAGADTMIGGTGNDVFDVDSVADVVAEALGGGIDKVLTSVSYALSVGASIEVLQATGINPVNLAGNAEAQTLTGNAGHNTLDGKAGADTMIGGAGNDTYIADVAADLVTELAAEGFDTVKTSAPAYTLPANVEVLTYTGVSAFKGTGNDLSNVITGGAGIDLLDGGAGADRLIGLGGNDTYIVDNLGDVVVEAVGQGLDTVKTASSAYQLGANVENLTYTGSGRFQGFGNALANVITGGTGNDTLDGRGGADRMVGGLGDDVYFVDNVNDIVAEIPGEGADRMLTTLNSAKAASAVETLIFIGTGNFQGFAHAQGSKVFGAAGNDTLIGSSGADLLAGMAGNDTLTGNGGSDIFYFDSALAGQGVDRITDFVSGVDQIQLRGTGFGVTSLADLGFVAGAAPVATDSRPSLLYDTATGGLWFDATGGDNADQVQIAVLTGRPALTLSDLLVA